MSETLPEVIVEKDYDGYFERLIKDLIAQKQSIGLSFKSKQIIITSGPYRSYAVSYRRDGDDLHIDFYSAIRSGFGVFSESDRIGLLGTL